MAQTRSDTTKTLLIRAAFKLFAENGYEGASTREIAAAAQTNIASINYHFGGKAGLRLACAETIVARFNRLRQDPEAVQLPTCLKEPQSLFENALLRQAVVILSLEEAQPIIRFMLREAHEEGEVFEHVYAHFFNPTFSMLYELFLQATGRDDSEAEREELKVAIFSQISMLAYFRIGEPVILRHQNWSSYQSDQIDIILQVLQTNIRNIVETYRRKT
nr:CerR family C-terminal domain-containing protein [uncultured Cohaesibacter sp.]